MALASGPNLGSPFGGLAVAGIDPAALFQRGLHWVAAWSTSTQGVSLGSTATVNFSSGQTDPFRMFANNVFTVRKGGLWLIHCSYGLYAQTNGVNNDSGDSTLALRLQTPSQSVGATGVSYTTVTNTTSADNFVGLTTVVRLSAGQTLDFRHTNGLGLAYSINLQNANMFMLGPIAPW